jgi:hypothetical protein
MSLFRSGGGRHWVIVSFLAFCLAVVLGSLAWGQVTSGSVTGIVSDPSGAVIPGAKVTLTDMEKGYTYPATTDATGRYLLTNLPPSRYRLTAAMQGFRDFVQSGIVLDVGSRLSVDVHMQLGTPTQSVEVTGAAPVLSTQDAVTGQEINRTMINNLPLVDRNVMDLAFIAPGVTTVPGRAFSGGNGIDFVSNGGRNDTSEVLIDGVAATSYEPNTGINTPLYTPNVDAVQEFKIMQNNYSAEEGFSGNTYINMVLRSGTNNFHGSVYEFLRNDKLDSNNWFSNASGGKLPPLRRNQFGGTIGGPIKKDKTFFFFDYDGTREHYGTTHNAGVPDTLERQGDFGELCARAGGTFNQNGLCSTAADQADGQLWDPYSGVYVPGTGRVLQNYIPFNNLAAYQSAGNPNLAGTGYELPATPGNLIDPVAYKMMQYYPMPNVGTQTATGFGNPYNNWSGSGVGINTGNQFDIRIDQRFTEKTAFYARYSQGWGTYHNWNCFGNAMDPCTQGPGVWASRMIALNLNHTFSPTTLLNVSLGFTRGLSDTKGIYQDFPDFNPLTTLGLPSYLATDNGPISAPNIYLYGGYAGANGPESIGPQPWSIYKNGNQLYHLVTTLTHMRGHHEFKFGGEFRVQQMNWFQDGTPGGVYIYDQYSTSQYPWWSGGDAMASFLTGTPSPNQWGEYEISPHFSTQNYRWGGFVQDNWRATDKLTVNLGLRYDLEIPRTERYNRMSHFDPTAPVPNLNPPAISAGDWMYKNGAGNTVPIPFAIPNVTSPMGGLVYATSKDRHIVNTYYKDFGPRVGIAYRFRHNMVFRAGYGLFYNPTQWGTTGAGPVGNEGFEPVTGWLTTMNGDGVTPWGRISDPEPGGLLLPTGPSLGLRTNLGTGINEPLLTSNIPPYTQTWSGGFQYEFGSNWLIEANYIGTKGTHLYYHGAGTMQYFGSWIEQAYLNPDLRAALGTYVTNPYYGLINTPGCGMCGPTIAAGNLMLPFPQFSGVQQPNPPWANSIYNALQIRLEKRLSNGLSLLATYTNSKSIDDSSVSTSTEWIGGFGAMRDPNNLKLERSLSEWDIPQTLQISYVYQLPFGKGKKYGGTWNPVVDAFLGGWQTSGMWRFDNGQPISVGATGGTAPWGYSASNPNQTGTLKVNPKSKWFTDGYFSNANQVLSIPPDYTIGNASRMEPNTRVPGTNNAALAIFKEFSLNKMREGSRLEFRAESFNTLNHPQFGNIANTFGNGNFGDVQSQVNGPREIQVALKLYF